MKRINFRLLFALAVSIICGTVACYYRPTIGNYGILILVGVSLSAFLLCETFYKTEPRAKRAVIVASCLFVSLCAYGRFLLLAENFRANSAVEGEYTITGTVREV